MTEEPWHIRQARLEGDRYRLEQILKGKGDPFLIPGGQVKPPAPPNVPKALNQRLDQLSGSRERSERLVNGVQHQYPGRSRTWCTEKAIADLERDRLR